MPELPFRISFLQTAHIDEVLSFYNLHNKAARTKSQFEWEFLYGPAGHAIYVIARQNVTGHIAGIHSALITPFETQSGETLLTGKLEDNLIDPKFRGQGLFGLMHQALLLESKNRNLQALWAFTYALKAFEGIGLKPVTRPVQGILVLSAPKAYKVLAALNAKNGPVKKAKTAAAVLAAQLAAFKLKWMPKQGAPLTFSETNGYVVPLTPHNGNITTVNYSCISHSEAYLNWRLYHNPYPVVYKYYILTDADGQPAAAALCELYAVEGYAFIAEFWCRQTLPESECAAFIVSAARRLEAEGAGLVRFWGYQTNAYGQSQTDLLKKAGFLFLNRGIPFVWKPLNAASLKPEQVLLSRLYTQGSV